jgi:hypothetical protein
MNRRTAGLAAILVVAIVLGAIREFLFINLNYQLDHVRYDRAVSYAHSMFRGWVAGMGLRDLVILKWILSLVFITLMMVLGILLSRLLHGSYLHARKIVAAYVLLSLLALGLNALSTGVDGWYNISIRLLHALQYPVILLFIWAAHRLSLVRG